MAVLLTGIRIRWITRQYVCAGLCLCQLTELLNVCQLESHFSLQIRAENIIKPTFTVQYIVGVMKGNISVDAPVTHHYARTRT